MAYDHALAQRIEEALQHQSGVTQRRMFGGLAMMHLGRMFIGIVGDELMVRVGPIVAPVVLDEDHVRPMDFTGRPMAGYVYVGPERTAEVDGVRLWCDRALSYVATLPVKPETAARGAKTAK